MDGTNLQNLTDGQPFGGNPTATGFVLANNTANLASVFEFNEGTGFADLDKSTFALEPGELGGPVESPAGWHLVQVVDVRDARFTEIARELNDEEMDALEKSEAERYQ